MREEIKSELLRLARELPLDQVPRFMGDIEEVRRTAEMQLHNAAKLPPAKDELLTVAEASKLLKLSKDMLYRNKYAFTRKIGRRRLISRQGIEEAIRLDDLRPLETAANITQPKGRKRLN